MMEEKWREQCTINETLKQRLADEEERFRAQMSERSGELTELRRSLTQALRDKEQLQEELQHFLSGRQSSQGEASVQQGAPGRLPLVLRYPLPYPQDPSPPPLVPQRPAELQYGNPYSTDPEPPPPPHDHAHRPPPEAPPTCAPPCAPPLSPSHPGPWDQEAVVCIQPSRSASPPEGAEETHKVADGVQPQPCDHDSVTGGASESSSSSSSSFCFDSRSSEAQRRCPLCEVIFPPHFEQRSLQRHLEAHWKVCPVCSEHFPPDCQQRAFERHVLTHFDGHVLNFEQIE